MTSPDSLDSLPTELLTHIYSFVGKDWKTFSLISKKYCDITRRDARIACQITKKCLGGDKQKLQSLKTTAPHTYSLNLRGQKISLPIINDIARYLPHLRFLNLKSCPGLTSKMLRELKPLTNLEKLDIGQVYFHHSDHISFCSYQPYLNYNFLSYHPELKQLNLSGWDYKDSELEKLRFCPKLEELNLKYPWSSSMKNLEFLKLIPNLKKLYLGFGATKLETDSLKSLRYVKKLKHLDITSTGFQGSDLKYLEYLPDLRALSIGSEKNLIEENYFEYLKHTGKLIKLDLSKSRCSNLILQYLEHTPLMQELSLQGCLSINDKGLDNLARTPSLHTLTIGPYAYPARIGLSIASHRLFEYPITDNGVQKLQMLQNLFNLTFVFCSGITENACSYLKVNENLKILKFYHCTRIGEAALNELKQLKNLSELVIHQCQIINDKKIISLKKALPNTKITYIRP